MKKNYSIIFFIPLVFSAKSQSLPAPAGLRCDLLLHAEKVSRNGIEVDKPLETAMTPANAYQFTSIRNRQPVLNWETDTSLKKITAWHILVASSRRLLNNNQGDYWDSKKMQSGHSRTVYKGASLQPGKIYYWKVRSWNENDVATPFSAAASFFLDERPSGDTISHFPLTAAIQKPVLLVKNNNGTYFLDFGKDAFGQLQLHLTSEKDDSIWIEAGEATESRYSIQKTSGNIRYIRMGLRLKKGTHAYTIEWPVNAKRNSRNPIQMPGYIGEVFPFRYVSIENFRGRLEKSSIQRKVIFYPFDQHASSFTSSDSVLNKVWDLCKYSMQATSFTGYYVDGDRERLPYEADALINQLSHYAVDAESSMARRTMAYLLFHPTWPTEWSLQNVLMAWNDYLYTGDDSFIKKYYTELQKKMLMPLAGNNGLISTRTNKQTGDFLQSIHITKDFDGKHGLNDNVDWPQRGNYIGNEKEYAGETDGFVYNDYNAVVNAFYYHNLVLMKQIALVLQKNEDANLYSEKAQEVYRSFQKVFVNPQTRLVKDGDSTEHSSLHANMFALAFGLVPKEDIEKVSQFIKSRKMACSVYGAQFLLDALYDANQGDYALQLLTATTQRSWYNMIRSGSTITMEAWDKVYKPNLDLNHAWGAAPGNIIVRKLMGVEPLSPGFETFRIKPQLGNLDFASLKTPTLKGSIAVSYRKKDNMIITEVIIPGGTTASIHLPHIPGKSGLTIDGQTSRIKPVNGFFIIENMTAGKHMLVMQ